MPSIEPDFSLERKLLAAAELNGKSGQVVVGLDEVGRGAIAGPVVVGAVAIDFAQDPGNLADFRANLPAGIKDSKLISPKKRETLAPIIAQTVPSAIGAASSTEIDEFGITAALALAAMRALSEISAQLTETQQIASILLDGSHNWLAPRQGELPAQVTTQVKADQSALSVASASVVAKVYRDNLMVQLAQEFPAYAWEKNKGYGAKAHTEALLEVGLSPYHRKSWNLKYAVPTAQEGTLW